MSWYHLSMDFIEKLPKSEGTDTILVVVDRLSKYAHFIPLKHPFTARSVADKFVKEIIRLHGIPRSIISDRDKVFMSNFWQEIFRLQGTALKHSTVYYPQSDGQSKVVNRCLGTYLRCFASGQPCSWCKWLAWAEYWYNTSYHTSTKHSPFQILYGRAPPILIRYTAGSTPVSSVEDMLESRDAQLDELKMQLLCAQQKMKVATDKRRRDEQFAIGNKVFVKLQPYRQRSLAARRNEKLSPRYYGPFEIAARIGEVAHKLVLPADSQVHPVFHMSQLRRAHGVTNSSPLLPQQLNADIELIVEPEELLGVRNNRPTGLGEIEVLLKWKALLLFEATWEKFSVSTFLP